MKVEDGDEESQAIGSEFNGSSESASSRGEEDEDASSSSSSSTSSSFPEGEIGNSKKQTMFSDDEEEETVKGPIRSKNEIVPEDLPPVPVINVVLEPQHRTSPVGAVLSVMDNKVIVEGSEKHNPLTEGSILWLTNAKLPLGFVDEIFGPVKNPYYVVRYNSSEDVPQGVHQGTTVSFVPEFSNYVLNDKEIYKKGYDASGDNDEEIADEFEFSDDEKELEFKKSQQQKMKRQKSGDKNWKQQQFADGKKACRRGGFPDKNRQVNSTGCRSSEPPVLPPLPPLIPDHRRLASPTSPFIQGNTFPSSSAPIYPPNLLASGQIPIASNNLVSASSFIPDAQAFGVCGKLPNSFGSLDLAHGVQEPGYSGNPPRSFLQKPNTTWTNLPSCPLPLQQPMFADVQSGIWNSQSLNLLQRGLVGNPSPSAHHFAFSAGLQLRPMSQVPGCMNLSVPSYPVGLTGTSFPGHMGPMSMFNAEQVWQPNANQCLEQSVLGGFSSFPASQQFDKNTAPDEGRKQPPQGRNFTRRKDH